MTRLRRWTWLGGLLALAATGCLPPQQIPLSGAGSRPDPHATLALQPSSEDDEPDAILIVRLAVESRGVQALPGTWDTATLRLEHPTVLTQPRIRNLIKGADITTSNGGVTYVANGALGVLRPKAGYTLTLSLWSGGAYQSLKGEKQLPVTLAAGANAITVPMEVFPGFLISAYSPASGIPGDTVTLSGEGFSVVPSYDLVTLATDSVTPMTATPSFTPVSSRSITTSIPTTPDLAPMLYDWQVKVGAVQVTRPGFTVLGTIGSALNWITTADIQQTPVLSYGNSRYLLAWVDKRTGSFDIFIRLVDTSGATLQNYYGGGTLLNEYDMVAGSVSSQRAQIAYNSAANQFLVVWQDSGNGNDVKGKIINSDTGSPSATVNICTLGSAQNKPVVDYGASQYAVIWQDNRGAGTNVYGQFLTSTGAASGSNVFVSSNASTNASDRPAIAYSPVSGQFLAVWEEKNGVKEIKGQMLNSNGALVGGLISISQATGNNQDSADVAVDPVTGDFIVVWHEATTEHILGRGVGATGTPVGSPVQLSTVGATGTRTDAAIAYEPWRQKCLVTFTDNRGSSSQVYGQYVARDGTLWGTNFPVTSGGTDHTVSDVAVCPTTQNGLAVCQDSAHNGDIIGQMVR